MVDNPMLRRSGDQVPSHPLIARISLVCTTPNATTLFHCLVKLLFAMRGRHLDIKEVYFHRPCHNPSKSEYIAINFFSLIPVTKRFAPLNDTIWWTTH